MATSIDPLDSAQAAGLRYVSDTMPGIRRRRAGKGFSYSGLDGKPIRERRVLDRIRSLAVPPAYTDVWICPFANGHIQATGRDDRGRKQYRYHPKWREVRDETKFGRMLAFSEALPKIRSRLERDLGLPGLPREKVLATVVRLLERTGIRVGNDEYARTNGSFGLTTLQNEHVEVSGSTMHFEFRGKSGKTHTVSLSDKRLARIVRRCQTLPGEDLFRSVSEEGAQQTIGSGDVNEYLRELTGEDFTAKDFRTWSGTLLALAALRDAGPSATEREAKSAIVRAIDQVASQLNNTRAVCRKYYVHPIVFDEYLAGSIENGNNRRPGNGKEPPGTGLSAEEKNVVRLLQKEGVRNPTSRRSTPVRSSAASASTARARAGGAGCRGNGDRARHHRGAVDGAVVREGSGGREGTSEGARTLSVGLGPVVEGDVVRHAVGIPSPRDCLACLHREGRGREAVVSISNKNVAGGCIPSGGPAAAGKEGQRREARENRPSVHLGSPGKIHR